MSSPTKIRLFIDAHSFDCEFQGTRTFIRELYRKLITCTDKIEYYIGACDIENLKNELDFIKGANFIKYTSTNSFSRIYFEIPRIIKENKINVAHFQYISPFRKHCDYIVTTHDILFNDFKSEFSFIFRLSRNFLFKYGIQHAAVKTTVSSYSRDRIAYHYNLDKKDIHIIPNGVSESFYLDFDKETSKNYISANYQVGKFVLYVSRIEPRKNNILLLDVWLESKLYEKNIALVFIGKTSIRSTILDETIEKMPPIAKKMFFHIEQVNDNDLLKFYQAAEVFVYPSKAEGFGIPPLEAAALKTPVLCSDKTAMSDYSFFGQNFFDPENKPELIEKLNHVLFGKDNMNYQAVSDEVKKNYSWKTSADKLYALLKVKYPGI